MTLTQTERDILNRIEGKIDDLNVRLDNMGERIAVVETRQNECPARAWSQPTIILAIVAVVVAAAPIVVDIVKG